MEQHTFLFKDMDNQQKQNNYSYTGMIVQQ